MEFTGYHEWLEKGPVFCALLVERRAEGAGREPARSRWNVAGSGSRPRSTSPSVVLVRASFFALRVTFPAAVASIE